MNTEPLTRPRRLRWQLIAVTLALAWLGGSLVWWFSPAGVQWRRMREAQRWIDGARPFLSSDGSTSRLQFRVSTAEEIWVTGVFYKAPDVEIAVKSVTDLRPPCPVRLISATADDGTIIEPRMLHTPVDR